MNADDHRAPEQLLSAALRAQATGSRAPVTPPAPPTARPRLPVLRVLLFAMVLGLLAGGIVAAATVL